MKNNIGLLLAKRALINPEREAFVDSKSGLRLSFSELNARCNRLLNSLVALGVEPEDRVAIAMMNSAEFIETYFAIAKLGAVIVPLNWRLVPDELEFILKDSGSSTLIFGEEFVGMMGELQSRGSKTDVVNWIQHSNGNSNCEFAQDYNQLRDAASDTEPVVSVCDDGLLLIMYTSGTTGLPKGVVHSHNTCFWALFTFAASCDLRDGDRYLVALPLFHVGSLAPVTLNVYRGVTSVVMKEFDPVRAWQLIQEEKINNSLLVPAMLNFMIQVPDVAQYDHSSLRWAQSGAAPLPVSLIQQYADKGIQLHQVYGLTESGGPACVISAEHALSKVGSTGRAFFHTEVRVVDEEGRDCAPGEKGEVWVGGKHIMLRYWNRPDATAQAITDEGWLRTGDVASMDDDGFVYIKDRIKDMIISGGENVYPAEIENVILTHPDVAEVAVIGQPSETWGESPFAIVVRKAVKTVAETDGQLTEADVLSYCEGKLGRFKLPKAVVFIDVIPRNANGKVLKRELRLQFPGPAVN
jgi:acyl-CoA synthetase (AMP-forming)/AMP-acid ligase II